MKNILLYICDPDALYLNRLNAYIQHREYSPFIVRTYTGLEALEKEDEAPGILLINSIYFEALQKGSGSHLLLGGRTPVIYLNEGGRGAASVMKKGLTGNVAADLLDKYQSARKIYDHILDVCAAQGDFFINPSAAAASPVRLIGVYTPENKQVQRDFAWSMAQKLGSSSHGLYLSLEEFFDGESKLKGLSGLIVAIKEAAARGMSATQTSPSDSGVLTARNDLVDYGVVPKSGGGLALLTETPGSFGSGRQEKSIFILDDYVQKDGDLDVMPPAACPYDLKEIGEEEWYYWLSQLMRQGIYTFIVVNFGNAVPGLCLLELCSELYMPSTAGDEVLCRRFKDTLKFMGKDAIADKLQLVSR